MYTWSEVGGWVSGVLVVSGSKHACGYCCVMIMLVRERGKLGLDLGCVVRGGVMVTVEMLNLLLVAHNTRCMIESFADYSHGKSNTETWEVSHSPRSLKRGPM